MTGYKYGDVVLINFVFSGGTGVKSRPALIISTDEYNISDDRVVIAAITGNTGQVRYGDYVLENSRMAGLLDDSVVTSIIRTIKTEMIEKSLGMIDPGEMKSIGEHINQYLGLNMVDQAAENGSDFQG